MNLRVVLHTGDMAGLPTHLICTDFNYTPTLD